jgi:hypothetical protein
VSDVFISYAREDADFVQKLQAALQTAHFETWIDTTRIKPTAEWKLEIFAAIRKAATFVFVVTPDSLKSSICLEEIDKALEYKKRIVPVIAKQGAEISHSGLARFQSFTFDSDNFPESFHSLLSAISRDLDWARDHAWLLERSAQWNGKARNGSFLLHGRELSETWKSVQKNARKEPYLTELQSAYVDACRRALYWRRGVQAIAAMAFGVLLLFTTDISDWGYKKSVSAAIASSLDDATDLKRLLGNYVESEFYCTWFQGFAGGKILYFSGSKSWISSGKRVRASILLSTLHATPNEKYRWYLEKDSYPSLYSRMALGDILEKATVDPESDLGLRDAFAIGNTAVEAIFREPGDTGPHPGIEGGIARLYATLGLSRTFGLPYEDLCQSKVVLNAYEHGFVVGGAPVDNCRGSAQGIYILIRDERPKQGDHLGQWYQVDRYPLFGDFFDKRCVK